MSLNAIEWLQSEHHQIDRLIQRVEDAEEIATRRREFLRLRRFLEDHFQTEEDSLYPLLRKDDAFRELVEENRDEHREIRALLKRVGSSADVDAFDEALAELIQCTDQHLQEEEKELFPKLRQKMSASELSALGEALERQRPRIAA